MGDWVDHDLSTFLGDGDLYGGTQRTQYSGGQLMRLGSGTFWRFAFPDITLSPTEATEVEVTFGTAGQDAGSGFNTVNLIALDALSGATFDDFASLADTDLTGFSNVTTPDGQVYTVSSGPGVYPPGTPGEDFAAFQTHFDTYVATGDRPYLLFRAFGGDTTVAKVRTRTGPFDAASTFLGAFLGTPAQPPLRIHPRSDGLGTSSTARIWPPSRSIQASNRRAGGYL